jgi:NAD(P)H-nitrite reductase large subunit
MDFTEDIRNAPDAETVCYCNKISKSQIIAAKTAGAKTLEDIKQMTGACIQGRCKETSPRKR